MSETERSPVRFPGIRRLSPEEWAQTLADDIRNDHWPERAFTRSLVVHALDGAAATIRRLREQRDLAVRASCIYCRRRWTADQVHLGHHDVCGDCHRANQKARREVERLREGIRRHRDIFQSPIFEVEVIGNANNELWALLDGDGETP